MLSLSLAMQKTGAAEWIALTFLGPVTRLGPLAATASILVITGALTMWISNHAAAALVAPIAINVALGQGIDAVFKRYFPPPYDHQGSTRRSEPREPEDAYKPIVGLFAARN